MSSSGRSKLAGRASVVLFLLVVMGCESSLRHADRKPVTGQGRRAQTVAAGRLAQDGASATRPSDDVPSKMVGPSTRPSADLIQEFFSQIADPSDLPKVLADQLSKQIDEIERNDRFTPAQKAQQTRDKRIRYENRLPLIVKRLEAIRRPRVVRLTFYEALRRSLANNYAIQADSYSPAILSAKVVEAEATFDAVYFANFNYNKQDRPSSSELESNVTDVRTMESGVRKLLSSGMSVQASYGLVRTESDLIFQTLNPSYFNNFVVQFQQPLLRGFGLDYNRSQIEINKLDREISIERLRKDIREIVFNLEQAYWQLLEARRAVGIGSQALADFDVIYDDLVKRQEYDVFRTQLSQTQSRIERQMAQFVQQCNAVKNAEDGLKRLMNDPNLNLSQDVEIIPVDVPSVEPLILDQIGEVAAGLANRSELHEAKLTIEKTQIGVGVAKNQALPKLDLLFRYVVDGLGSNADRAFSQLSENDYNEYVVGLQFEWPIADRGPEAVLRQARLQQAQAIAAHRDTIENVILEIQTAVRDISTNYDQLGPTFRWARSARQWVEATQARQEKRDPANLQVELDSQDTLQVARQQMLDALVRYNIALSNLERQKGTLLEYDGIVIHGAENASQMVPYHPTLSGGTGK
jgi:outer membrane protein